MRVLLLLLVPLVHGVPVHDQEVDNAAEQMVDLFLDRDGREIEVDEDGLEATDISTNLASSEDNEEKSIQSVSLVQETDPIEIARFNNYMDAIYRRMNAALRAKLMDPMILNLDTKKKSHKTHHKERKERKERREARKEDHEEHSVSKREAEEMEENAVEEVEEDSVAVVETEEGTGRKLDRKTKKNKDKKNKHKKTGEKKKKGKGGKGKNKKGKKKGNRGKKADLGEKKEHKGKKEGEHKEKKEGRKEKKEGHKEKKGGDEAVERTKRNKHSNDKAKGKGKGKKSEDDLDAGGKSMGSLAGIATLRRSKDVVVMNSESHKIVKSDFTIGPLQLEVSKTFGKGQARSVKTAKAVTEELAGKMVLKVKPDGSAYVKSVFFHKPENVEVKGSLGNQKKRSDTYLKNSVGKVRPLAAQRILKMARYVLKSPSTVERS